jgi:hypothetical protein
MNDRCEFSPLITILKLCTKNVLLLFLCSVFCKKCEIPFVYYTVKRKKTFLYYDDGTVLLYTRTLIEFDHGMKQLNKMTKETCLVALLSM